jgi:uncharacterized protein
MASVFESDMLPTVIPLFPLTGAILLPRARLPLNIFEPRYLAMTRDAMARERIIGMIQPLSSSAKGKPALFGIGCAGRISQFSETPDGRFLITLTGLCRFTIQEELSVATPYRQAQVSYAGFETDRQDVAIMAAELRERLLEGLRRYLDRLGMAADWDSMKSSDDEALVNALAMVCPFDGPDKQALVEAATVPERARSLIALMAFAAAEPTGEDAPVRH